VEWSGRRIDEGKKTESSLWAMNGSRHQMHRATLQRQGLEGEPKWVPAAIAGPARSLSVRQTCGSAEFLKIVIRRLKLRVNSTSRATDT
jgi:hypothetical protein